MLKKIFKPKYVKFDEKYTTLSPEDKQTMETSTADICDYVHKSKEANKPISQ